MRRFAFAVAGACAIAACVFAPSALAVRPDCDEPTALCTEVVDSVGYEGAYIGHDEPSLLFYSDTKGAGNSTYYRVQLPEDANVMPNQQGTAGTWNFQLHPALWFGMALCDNESAPEYTHERCKPDSDSNIFNGSDPGAPDYIGKHPGAAFLEVQFYPPGWAPWPPGLSCDATQWCAAMAIFSLNLDMNTNTANNDDCLNTVGLEPANFAFLTKSGVPHAPPGPLDLTNASFTPNSATDLFMHSGDVLTLDIHDGADGLTVIVNDLTTGETGSMTASAKNGFAQVRFQPNASTCHERPYTFRPMYATSSEQTRVPWAAHSYNVAFSDEIGHFEYCKSVPAEGGDCADNNEPKLDEDDTGCFSAAFSTLVPIGGCIATDNDFDGTSYQRVWPGTSSDRSEDRRFHPTSILFTSPLFNATENYDRIAFEADLPRIEAADFGGRCNRTTGEHCANPPPGAKFYPIFTTGSVGLEAPHGEFSADCFWQFGGTNIRGTTRTFGGDSRAEFGPLLQTVYPGAGFTPVFRYNNFRNVLSGNPCPT